jgi:hypothetical protein
VKLFVVAYAANIVISGIFSGGGALGHGPRGGAEGVGPRESGPTQRRPGASMGLVQIR